MKTDLLRWLDKWLGTPLCWGLSLLSRGTGLLTRDRKGQALRPRKVLIIKLAEMGSTVLAYPGIAELKSRAPEVELFFLVFEKNRHVLDAVDIEAGREGR